jgi:hypothetical protein
MALIEFIRPIILAAGFLFILVGMNIFMIEQPAYNDAMGWLYTLILYTFYLYLVFVFLSIIVSTFDALLQLRAHFKH